MTAVFFTGNASAQGNDQRVALVVGNGAYETLSSLENPVQDAEAISQSLSSLGFTVFLTTNLRRDEFERALRFFLTRATTADTALLYFAGHGATLDGKSFVFPTDFGAGNLFDLREAISLDHYLNQAGSRLRTNLVIVDACRENPLQSEAGNGSLVQMAGLSDIATGSARVGTLMSFATTPGKVAYDGAGPHSPFTGALLDHIATPGVGIETVMRAVRRDVVVNTNGAQVPWIESSLLTNVRLADGARDPISIQRTGPDIAPRTSRLSAILSETGFAQKPVLTRLNAGFRIGDTINPNSAPAPENGAEQRSARIKSLLCSVIESPLPAECR